jgi:hypothetical protein
MATRPNHHLPVDDLGMNIQPNIPIYYAPGATTDDTKFAAGEITTLIARGVPQ